MVTIPDQIKGVQNSWFESIASALGVKLRKYFYYARCNTCNIPPEMSELCCPKSCLWQGLDTQFSTELGDMVRKTVRHCEDERKM